MSRIFVDVYYEGFVNTKLKEIDTRVRFPSPALFSAFDIGRWTFGVQRFLLTR